MRKERRKFSAAFKAKVALEAIKKKRRFNNWLQNLKFMLIRLLNENVSF